MPAPAAKANKVVEAPSRSRDAKTPYSLYAPSGPYSSFLSLQHAAGNLALSGLVSGGRAFLQRKCKSCAEAGGECEDCKHMQRKARGAAGLAGAAQSPSGLPASVQSVLGQAGGRALDDHTRTSMESLFGRDLSDVRVHTGSRAEESVESVDALAYTVGHNIVFGPGQYAPDTVSGRRLLTHEVAHTVQQAQAAGSIGEGQAGYLEAEAERIAQSNHVGAMLPGGRAPLALQRQANPNSLAEAPDPISTVPAGYSWRLVSGDFSQLPGLDEVRQVVVNAGIVEAQVMAQSQAAWVPPTPIRVGYWSFRHPALHAVARAFGSKSGWSLTLGTHYGVYALVPESFQPVNATPTGHGTGAGKPGKQTQQAPGAGTSAIPGGGKPPAKAPGAGTDKQPAKGAGAPTPPTAAPGSPAAPAPAGAGASGPTTAATGSPAAPAPGAAAKDPASDEKLARLNALPDDVKALIFSDQAPTATPESYDQLLRIAEKLKALEPQDRVLYKLVAKNLTQDLDAYEKSIDVFIKVKEKVRAQAQAPPPQAAPSEPTLSQQLSQTFDTFDESKFGTMDASQKEQLATQIAAEQRDIILKHAITHPGETVAGMAEGLVRPDKVANDIATDLREALNGDANGWARLGGAAGAAGKYSGWLAGVAGVLAVAMLFIPGANVAEMAAYALALGIGSMTLAGVESQARLKAAGQAKTPEEFKTQTEKAGVAEANFAMQAALLVFALMAKLVARIPLPGRLQTVGNALKLARAGLLEKTGIGPALESIRSDLIAKLKGAKPGLQEALAQQAKALADIGKAIEGISGDEFIKRLADGDPALQDLGISPEQAKAIQQAAQADTGKQLPEQIRQEILKGIHDAPGQAGKTVDKFLNDVDQTVSDVQGAKDPNDLAVKIDSAEHRFDPAEVARKTQAESQSYLKERVNEQAFQGKSDADVRAAAVKDPAAADELLRRYRGKKLPELKSLSKKGDATADYEIGRRKNAGYAKPAEAPVRPSNLAVLDRLKVRLAKSRGGLPMPKEGSAGGTLGVAETDLPVGKTEFEGGSPMTGEKPDPTYKPPTKFPRAQGHAEQNLVGPLKKAILDAKLSAAQMKGKTVYMLIEQVVCQTCKAGLFSESAAAGVLKQFSAEFPEITIEVSNLESGEVLRIKGGSLVQ